jgi:hypothetical protein
VTDWSVVFLGVRAVALVAMAVTQILVCLAILKATRQLGETVTQMQRDLRPLIDKVTRMTDDAARVTALALTQVERIDHLVASISVRVEETVSAMQDAVAQPIRQGAALVAGLKAVFAAIREWQSRGASPRDDEDPLFVG